MNYIYFTTPSRAAPQNFDKTENTIDSFTTSLPPPPLETKNTVDKNNVLRVDFLFSYWIFLWFLLYYSAAAAAPHPSVAKPFLWINPKFALYIALIENIINFIIIFKYLTFDIFFKYIAMLLCVKVLPIYLLYDTKTHFFRDIIGTAAIFMIYLAWLNYNNTTLWEVYSRTFQSITRGENNTPFFAALNWLSQ